MRELISLFKLKTCENLVNFKGFSLSDNGNYIYLITEFCSGGNLFDFLHKNKNLIIPLKQKIKFIKEIALGLRFLHSNENPIIHRDLKSMKFFTSFKFFLYFF